MHDWMNGYLANRWMDGSMDGSMDGWVDKWMDERMVGQMGIWIIDRRVDS